MGELRNEMAGTGNVRVSWIRGLVRVGKFGSPVRCSDYIDYCCLVPTIWFRLSGYDRVFSLPGRAKG